LYNKSIERLEQDKQKRLGVRCVRIPIEAFGRYFSPRCLPRKRKKKKRAGEHENNDGDQIKRGPRREYKELIKEKKKRMTNINTVYVNYAGNYHFNLCRCERAAEGLKTNSGAEKWKGKQEKNKGSGHPN